MQHILAYGYFTVIHRQQCNGSIALNSVTKRDVEYTNRPLLWSEETEIEEPTVGASVWNIEA